MKVAQYTTKCSGCGGTINPGDPIVSTAGNRYKSRRWFHAHCDTGSKYHDKPSSPAPTPEQPEEPEQPEQEEPEQEEEEQTEPEQAKPTDTATPSPAGDLGRILGDLVGPYVRGKVDRSEVEAIVRKTLEDFGPVTKTLEIKRPDSSSVKIEGAHQDFEKILARVQVGRSVGYSVFLHGDPGSGKSTICQQVATALGLPFYMLSLSPMSPPSRLEGYGAATRGASGDDASAYIPSDCYKAFRFGGLLCIEEMANANDGLLTAFNAALANGKGSFPVVGTVDRHEDFVLMATDNTPGLGPTRAFPGRRRLDAAFRDRFVYRRVEYDLGLEERLARSVNPEQAKTWVATCRRLRKWLATNAPEVFVTPRSCLFGAGLLTLGLSEREAAEECIFRGAEAELVNRACEACGVES